MTAKNQQGSNRALVLMVLLVMGIAFPLGAIYFAADFVPKFKEMAKGSSDGPLFERDVFDPGPAWLQTRPIMIPDGRKGYMILRAYLRTPNRKAAEYICVHHPRLADEIQQILMDKPDVISDAYNDVPAANRFVKKALISRIGKDLFSKTIVSNTQKEMMAPTDTSRYECHKVGLRLVYRPKK